MSPSALLTKHRPVTGRFITADGYVLRLDTDGRWSDGDLSFARGTDGKPVTENGATIDGDLVGGQ